MRALAGAGAGFLLAVLWFDLMFDVQVRRHPRGAAPVDVLDSISAYYARVTTGARPMNRLVALAMVVTLVALVAGLVRDELPAWRSIASIMLTAGAVALAGGRTVPAAVRLGRRGDDVATRERLARSILADHVTCLAAIAAVLLLQLLPA